MEAYQARVVIEQEELSEKLTKLRAFCNGQIFEALPSQERGRLTRQLMAMSSYLNILNERIAAWGL